MKTLGTAIVQLLTESKTVRAWHRSHRESLNKLPIWFGTSRKMVMADYEGNLFEVAISYNNPYDVQWMEEITEDPRKPSFLNKLRKEGYDLIRYEGGGWEGTWLVPLNLNQVRVIRKIQMK